MPTYDYKCSSCLHKFEEIQKFSADKLVKCPKCSKDTLERLIGCGAGFSLKGGGWSKDGYSNELNKSIKRVKEAKDRFENAKKDT